MEKITINRYIRDCRDCPNVVWERSDRGIYYNCYCTENNERRLIEEDCLGIGTKVPNIPEWCPCKSNI